MRRLIHELGASILASKKDAAAVDAHDIIPCLFGHLVYHSMMLCASYASVIDHTELMIALELAIPHYQVSSEYTYTSSLPPALTAV